jgi:hypothetical protein
VTRFPDSPLRRGRRYRRILEDRFASLDQGLDLRNARQLLRPSGPSQSSEHPDLGISSDDAATMIAARLGHTTNLVAASTVGDHTKCDCPACRV